MFNETIISISGLPGSGTTTAAKKLSEMTGMDIISTGEIFRELAKEKGYTVEEFGIVAEKDKEIDLELDDRMIEKAQPGNIMEGRLTGQMLNRSSKGAFKVWIEADKDVRLKRIAEREGMSLKKTKELVDQREKSERKRYIDYYGIDLLDKKIYDLVIDSGKNTPEEIASKIIEGVRDGPY